MESSDELKAEPSALTSPAWPGEEESDILLVLQHQSKAGMFIFDDGQPVGRDFQSGNTADEAELGMVSTCGQRCVFLCLSLFINYCIIEV